MKNNLIRNFYIFKSLFKILDLGLWAFYAILLYKITGDFRVLLLEALIFYTSLWLFFILGSFFLNKIGYIRTLKISFFFFALTTFSLFVFIKDLQYLFWIFAFLRAIPRGLYHPVENTFTVKEIPTNQRVAYINSFVSFELIMAIIVPALAGLLINFDESYKFIFLLATFLYLGLAISTLDSDKKSTTKVSIKEIMSILRMRNFRLFAVSVSYNGLMDVIFVLIFSIVPFLFLESEIKVGFLMSGISLLAAIFSLGEIKISFKKRVRLAYFGYLIKGGLTVAFAFFWNIPALIIRSVGLMLSFSLSDTLVEELNIDNKELLLGKERDESSIELNIILETIYFLTRIIAIVLILTILYILNQDFEKAIRVILVILGFWNVLLLSLQLLTRKSLSRN